jgi:hypothetical protein
VSRWATALGPREHDPCALLAAAVVEPAVADIRDAHYVWDVRHFFLIRLHEPDSLWGDLLGDLGPQPTRVRATMQMTARQSGARSYDGP